MEKKCKRILVLGASGMLGNAIFRYFSSSVEYNVFGTIRTTPIKNSYFQAASKKLISNVDILNPDSLLDLCLKIRPEIIINCVGIVKQLHQASDPLLCIPINSLLPHRLAKIADLMGARLVHISTDCVFSGSKGLYSESDSPDAEDLYGRTKLIGEVQYKNSITLRTSIIGHELLGNRSLVNWFLSQNGSVKGYTSAIFSGLPTVELARVIKDFVIPNRELSGLFHISADPISKFDLLKLIAYEYKKEIKILPDDSIRINRSLNSDKFRLATGFKSKVWPALISEMRAFG